MRDIEETEELEKKLKYAKLTCHWTLGAVESIAILFCWISSVTNVSM